MSPRQERVDRLSDLYDMHAAPAIRFAYLLTRDRNGAEEIVQEAFVRLVARFADLRAEDRFSAYLRRTVINLAKDRHRAFHSERSKLQRIHGAPSSSRDIADVVGTREMLRLALDFLPRRQRVVLVLRFYEDLSEVETADVMGCSVPAVKSLTSRALTTLRSSIGKELDDEV